MVESLPSPPGANGTMESCVARTVLSLPDGTAAAFQKAIRRQEPDWAQLEASVRGGAGSGVRGGRLMVQRARPELALDLDAVLALRQADQIGTVSSIAEAEGVPLIVGWDISRPRTFLKLYVNASDSSEQVRSRVASRLGLPALPGGGGPPHVFGFNLTQGGCETKVYWQSNDVDKLATHCGETAAILASQFAASAAGAVVSWDVEAGGLGRRAFFVAIRGSRGPEAQRACRSLPCWSDEAVEAALPFEPGPPSTIGISLRSSHAWTAYFQPRAATREPLSALSPDVCLRLGSSEIGLFVHPASSGAAAAVRTALHVVSYRVREGEVPGPAIDRVLRWAAERVTRAEREGLPIASCLNAPPAPWLIVAE